jgi:hypothetical protein
MGNITIHCKKDFRGNIDIRDFVVKRAIDENNTVTVTCGSFPGRSIYTPEELKNPIKISEPYTSRFGKVESYRLHSYPWKFEE